MDPGVFARSRWRCRWIGPMIIPNCITTEYYAFEITCLSSATKIEFELEAHSGTRIMSIYTPLPVREITKVKKYAITFPDMEEGETRTILLKLSLSAFTRANGQLNETLNQNLISPTCTFIKPSKTVASQWNPNILIIHRRFLNNMPRNLQPSIDLDYHLNRYITAQILNAVAREIELELELELNLDQKVASDIYDKITCNITDLINTVDESSSCHDERVCTLLMLIKSCQFLIYSRAYTRAINACRLISEALYNERDLSDIVMPNLNTNHSDSQPTD
jgi:hypothetical protein